MTSTMLLAALALTVDLEAGPLAVLQNDQRYGPTGTPYTAQTVALDRNLFLAQRIALEARLGGRHTFIATHAPLDVTTRVALAGPLDFRGTVFPAGAVVDHRYLFESWRASYLYRGFEGAGWTLEGGATLGVRNAVVSLSDVTGTRFAAERDIGPIPALKLRVRYDAPVGLYALVDVDAGTTLGSSTVSGGIFDGALTLGVPLWPGLDWTLRLRTVAGGAVIPARDISNWATLASASTGLRYAFGEQPVPR